MALPGAVVLLVSPIGRSRFGPGLAARFVVALIGLILTTVASNAASAAILIPLAIP